MGYGRGHAMRTASVLPAIAAEHEVTVFTTGDAYPVLSPMAETVRIPMVGYRYNDHGGHSLWRTLQENAPQVADLIFRGEGLQAVEDEFKRRKIDVVISDSEAWCHRAARNLGIPRISFDHVGILAYCKAHFPPDLLLAGLRDGIGYRAAMGIPERILISSFYPAQGKYPGVKVVGPMLRDVVRQQRATRGDYLLAYFNKGDYQFTAQIQRTLSLLDFPVRVYGTQLVGEREHLSFCPPSNEGFVRDLAGCRAVLSTAGNQLIGEAIHFGKPILAMPEDAFEQRLNAHMIERMGVGAQVHQQSLNPSHIDRFLAEETQYRHRMREHAGDGRAEAVRSLLQYVDELARPRAARRQATPQNATPFPMGAASESALRL
jgi:uncharacterized protein (TIGR00661 family)